MADETDHRLGSRAVESMMTETQETTPSPADEAQNGIEQTAPASLETAADEQPMIDTAEAGSIETEGEAEAVVHLDEEAAAAQVPAEEEPTTEEVPAQEPVEEEEEPDDGRAWFVVHSYSGYENKVKTNLEHRIESMNMQDKIFKVVVPTEEEIEIKEGSRRRTKKRVFPGYVLVQMLMDEESWYAVRNTPGVTGFVGSGSRPTPLRPEEAAKIFKRMEMEAPKIKVGFREGQTVRIVDGPFTDFVGTVEELNLEKGRVRVMVSFFGRETPVELDFLQVQKQ